MLLSLVFLHFFQLFALEDIHVDSLSNKEMQQKIHQIVYDIRRKPDLYDTVLKTRWSWRNVSEN